MQKKSKLHEEKEVDSLRLDIAKEFILLIYRNLAAHWWWDGHDIKAQVEQDLVNPDRYNLNQTEESAEYDPFKYPLKPHNLGYLLITRVDSDNPKPIDVKLVCSWSTVLSFWEELDSVLKQEYPTIEPKQNSADAKEAKKIKPSREIKIPRRFADLDRWREVYKLIQGWTGMSSRAISEKMRKDARFKHLPVSRETIAKIIEAGKAGLLV